MTAAAEAEPRRGLLAALLVFAAPFFLAALYLVLSRWPLSWFTSEFDYLALAVAIIPGIAGIMLLSVPHWQKALLAAIYAAAMALLLIWFSLVFVCAAFGNCL